MIYLSGPMTGIEEHNYPAFEEACRLLRALGDTVVSPHEVVFESPAEWAEYLRRDLIAMLGCNEIVLLPGWEKSRGACLELHIAQALGFSVHRFVEGRLEPFQEKIPMSVYDRKFEEQRLRDAYRDKARDLVRGAAPLEIKVSPTANVHPMADGAFVECSLWVPKELL